MENRRELHASLVAFAVREQRKGADVDQHDSYEERRRRYEGYAREAQVNRARLQRWGVNVVIVVTTVSLATLLFLEVI
jgi:hypothetical protein